MNELKVIEVSNEAMDGDKIVERYIKVRPLTVDSSNIRLDEGFWISDVIKFTNVSLLPEDEIRTSLKIGFYSHEKIESLPFVASDVDNAILFRDNKFFLSDSIVIEAEPHEIAKLQKGLTYKLGLLYLRITELEMLSTNRHEQT